MMRPVYCVSLCDAWRTPNSMRLQTVCTTLPSLKRVLRSGIKSEFFFYKNTGHAKSISLQLREFNADWNACNGDFNSIDRVLDNLAYAYVEEIIPNSNPFD